MSMNSPRPSSARAIFRGLRGLRREGRWGSTLSMLCLAMVMLQTLVAGVIVLRGVHELLLARSGIHVEVARGTSDRDVQSLYAALKELPYVESVEYIPNEKALELEQRRHPELVDSLKQFAVANPFPDSFSVVLYSLDSYDELLTFIGGDAWGSKIDPASLGSVATQQEEVRTYLAVSTSVMTLGYVFLGLGIVTLLAIILDIAYRRAYEREDELLLERVMGASTSQVLLPFAAEMGTLLLIALLVGVAAVAALIFAVPALLPELAYGVTFEEARAIVVPEFIMTFPLAVLAQAILFPAFGFLSGLAGSRSKFTFRPS